MKKPVTLARQDKQKQFAVGFAVGLGLASLLSTKSIGLDIAIAAVISLTAVVLVALGRKTCIRFGDARPFEHRNGSFKDAVATIAGGISGSLIAFLLWR